MDTLIAHVDLDAFFASCEQRDNPEYRNRPVVVGARPGGRGVVAAASYEARRYGIHSAMPIAEAARRCPEAVFVRPDMARYVAVSRQVFATLEAVIPLLEKASIDEAYLDISGLEKLYGPPAAIGQRIKTAILDGTGLRASVGIGPNRLIAKLASEAQKPDGLTVVAAADVQKFLDPLPVAALRGNGPVTQRKFRRLGLSTIGQLRATPAAQLAQQLGERAARGFLRQANGEGSTTVVSQRRRKSISKERTFQADNSSAEFLRDQLTELARSVAAVARRENLAGRVIKLKVRFSDFTTVTRQSTLASGTQDERTLRNTAWQLFTNGSLPTRPVRLIGLGLSDWQEASDAQHDLFAEPASPGAVNSRLLQTIDKVSDRFGADKLQLGVTHKRR